MKEPGNIVGMVELDPDYMGFILYPGSKRFIADLEPGLISDIPSKIKTTGVFVDEDLQVVKDKIKRYRLKAVQLHGKESPDYCRELKADAEVIKAFGINDTFDFNQLDAYTDAVDYFLFDTQSPEHGGSGKTFNWQLLKSYTLEKPYFLSGGIGIGHAEELLLINDERLYAVDVNSGFEKSPGLKDIGLLYQFKDLLGC